VSAAREPRPLVTVVVPAYNEALLLMGSLTAIHEHMQGLTDRYRFEMLIVDDGSTDETPAIAAAFAASRPHVRLLRHKVNFRLGQTLRYAFSESRGDYVVVIDSDLSYSVDHISRMLETMETEHARVVIASPYMKGGTTTAIPWRREFMSKSVNRLLAATSHYDVSTVTGLVRCYDGPFIRSLDLKAMGPEINTEILYKSWVMRARMVEIPAHLDWTGQEERLRTRRFDLRISTTSRLLMMASFLFRPILFFLIPGVFLAIIAAWTLSGVLIMVVEQFPSTTGSLDSRITDAFARAYELRPHSFIVGGFALVIAVQLITLGVLATQTKRYFEELYHLGTMLNRRAIQLERQSPTLVAPTPPASPDALATSTDAAHQSGKASGPRSASSAASPEASAAGNQE
jgi:glycosyltransferase involved in cell wall biosynthesis